MNRTLLPLLKCPSSCNAALLLQEDEGDQDGVVRGCLRCEGCGAEYAIDDGIPRLLPPNLRRKAPPADEEVARKQAEMRARDEQAGAYDAMWYLNAFGLIEIPATLAHLDLAPRHTLLEAGCGTGRMTRSFAKRCERLISADFSWESLQACAAKLRRSGVSNVDLIQADICHLPLRDASVDRVVSCQVLEHIPTPAARADAVREMGRSVRNGGNVVISAYQYSLLMRLFGEKEGEHDGGIYFHRFRRDELRALLSSSLSVERITGALVYHYIARCRKREG